MGPVVSAVHRENIEKHIRSGVEEGATLLLGGARPTLSPLDKGYFVMPTIFTDVTQDMSIAREEIFGPVACIMKFSSDDEVIELANDNNYGLAAVVWTRNMAKARRFVNELQVGSVFVNTHMLTPEMPWGGSVKESGLGKEGSLVGMAEFTELKLVCWNMAE